MKVDLKAIIIAVMALLLALLLFRVFACNKAQDSGHKPAQDLRDTLIQEYRRSLARDSVELLRKDDSIRARDARIEALKRDRGANQQKKQTVKDKSEQIKKHIDSDAFPADSIRAAFSEFD